jgi:hypothetical protein
VTEEGRADFSRGPRKPLPGPRLPQTGSSAVSLAAISATDEGDLLGAHGRAGFKPTDAAIGEKTAQADLPPNPEEKLCDPALRAL